MLIQHDEVAIRVADNQMRRAGGGFVSFCDQGDIV